MGGVSSVSSVSVKALKTRKGKKILMLGLDGAGKTTLLNKLKLGKTVKTATIGFTIEEVHYKSVKFIVWDVSGQKKVRSLWRRNFTNADALIWLVDSANKKKFNDTYDELLSILQDRDFPSHCPLLIYANKQDVPGAQSAKEVCRFLKLDTICAKNDREWSIQPSIATKGHGVYEGFEWLVETLRKQKRSETVRINEDII